MLSTGFLPFTRTNSMFFGSKEVTKGQDPSNFVYLITGTDSGFGLLSSIALAKQGFIVYAGCLTKEGVDHLKNLHLGDNLRPLKMNVCVQVDVSRVVERIKREEGKLFCLINNAGIADGTFLELTSMESWERTIQVNLIGAVRMCKASIPLLRDFGGGARILNISSAASFATTGGMTSYSASKAAIRMAGDSLRFELAHFGIHVTSIMPGFFKTDIVKQPHLAVDSFKKQPKDIQDIYGAEFVASFLQQFDKSIVYAPNPQICVDEIIKVSKMKTPPTDRPIGYDSWFLWYFLFWIPNWIKVLVINLLMRSTWNKLLWKPNASRSSAKKIE